MAAEDIGELVPTKIPGLSDQADIQAALRLYHYGSYTFDTAETDPTELINPSIAYTLNDLQDQIDSVSGGSAIQATSFNAKGDLLSASANDTLSVLSVGSNGKVLTANSATATGLEWATPSYYSAPTLGSTSIASGSTVTTVTGLTENNAILTGTLTAGGSAGTSGQVLQSTGTGVQWANVSSTPRIGQVVTATTTNITSTSGSGWIDASGLSVSITPTSTTSKIFIASTFGIAASSGSSSVYFNGYVQLVRASTTLQSFFAGGYYPNGGGVNTATYTPCAISYVDSPASTSAQTYKIQINNIVGASTFSANPSGTSVQIIAMEILP